MMMLLCTKRATLVLAGLLALVSAARAEDEEFPPMSLEAEPAKLPWRTFELCGGVSYASVSSTLTVSRAAGGAGVAIDAEGVLGMSREVLCPQVWAAYRLGGMHRILASFEDMSRSATRTLSQDIEFNGNTYTVGTTVHSVYGIQVYGLTYAWSFLQDDRMDIALTAGFNTLRLHASIAPDDPTRYESQRFIFPIPLPGLTADFLLTPSFWLRQRLEL